MRWPLGKSLVCSFEPLNGEIDPRFKETVHMNWRYGQAAESVATPVPTQAQVVEALQHRFQDQLPKFPRRAGSTCALPQQHQRFLDRVPDTPDKRDANEQPEQRGPYVEPALTDAEGAGFCRRRH